MIYPHPLLTKLTQGYVAWRGRNVEHFSFSDPEDELLAACRLASHCEMLEEKGFPVTARTCMNRLLFQQAPADTPWLKTMTSYYAIFADQTGQARRCIFALPDHAAVAIGVDDGQLAIAYGYEAAEWYGTGSLFHELQDQGLSCCATYGGNEYDPLVSLFTQVGLTPHLVETVLAMPVPERPQVAPAECMA
ncbi:hypothetical protein ACFPOU_17035 [Massilia jejuensis]|uniref:Uncharacterized protein n=1 Tax=Massilia jejuensis TaxID=648894 RepID=A0ABW0PJD2_9BURK